MFDTFTISTTYVFECDNKLQIYNIVLVRLISVRSIRHTDRELVEKDMSLVNTPSDDNFTVEQHEL